MKKILYLSIICGFALLAVAGHAAAATTISTSINTAGTLTVGADAAGTDVLFYTDATGEELLWDASANELLLDGTDGANVLEVTDGNVTITDDLIVSSQIGIGSSTPQTLLAVQGTTEQLRLGYDSANYVPFTVSSGGDLTVAPSGNELNITGALTVSGTSTLGDAATDVVILNSRMATGNESGSALDITSSYLYGEANELRYTISTWPTGQTNFQGIYMKLQNNADSSQGLRGIQFETVANNVNMNNVEGGYFNAWQKGGTARTVGTMYGVTAELMFDESSDVTFATSSAAFRGIVKTDSTMVNEELNLQGIDLVFGTTNGPTSDGTIFAGIKMEDDPNTTGSVTLQYGIDMLSLAAVGSADLRLHHGTLLMDSATALTITATSTNIVGNLDVTGSTTLVDLSSTGIATLTTAVINGTNGATALLVPDGNVVITDDLTVNGTFTVAGGFVFDGNLSVNGYATTTAASGNFWTEGAIAASSTLNVVGTSTLVDLNSTGIATMTTAYVTGNLRVDGAFSPVDFTPSGNVTLAGYLDLGGYATTTVANGNFWTEGEIRASTTLNVLGTSTLVDLNSTGIATLTTAVLNGTTNLFGVLTVGADSVGTDVLFYTDVAGEELLWDASENMLTIDGSDGADALQVTDGNVAFSDNLAVTGVTTLTGNLLVNGYATTTATSGAFAAQGSGAFGTTTPTSKLDIFTTGTSTVIIDSSTKGGCLCLKDIDAAGYTCIAAKDGAINYASYATEAAAAACGD